MAAVGFVCVGQLVQLVQLLSLICPPIIIALSHSPFLSASATVYQESQPTESKRNRNSGPSYTHMNKFCVFAPPFHHHIYHHLPFHFTHHHFAADACTLTTVLLNSTPRHSPAYSLPAHRHSSGLSSPADLHSRFALVTYSWAVTLIDLLRLSQSPFAIMSVSSL